MISTVYLILVLYLSGSSASNGGKALTTVQIPQTNMKQCEINKNAYTKGDDMVVRSYCIVGVIQK